MLLQGVNYREKDKLPDIYTEDAEGKKHDFS